ncbi:hypothetical protein [Brevundimonas sp.]|uniref:hypothetical protein n=1 Tax=Brevundimonas sp. TaxID=1871086 RepID=UPI00289FEA82|nr:hypothetical protein [Brevundimonas sp.]
MKERPILFSGPMIRALLSGQKTQTRRVVKPMLKWAKQFPICKPEGMAADHEIWWWDGEHDRVGVSQSCPYGQLGDRLWVKETWRPTPTFEPWDLDVTYRADGHTRTIKDGEFGERDWTIPKAAATGNVSPLFMPRWASRLTLLITDIRVERLQDISEADAIAEGAPQYSSSLKLARDRAFDASLKGYYREGFSELWEAINGKGSWDTNPWVWTITFEVAQ